MWVLLKLVVFCVKGTQHMSSVVVGGVLKRAKGLSLDLTTLCRGPMCSS